MNCITKVSPYFKLEYNDFVDTAHLYLNFSQLIWLFSNYILLPKGMGKKKDSGEIPQGDATKGAKVFKQRCDQCHTVQEVI